MTQRILILLLLLAIDANGLGLVRYVDSAAAGGGNGQSWATAWNAFSQITGVGPGDTVYVSGGTTTKTYNLGSGWSIPAGTAANRFVLSIGQEAGHNGVAIVTGTVSGQFELINNNVDYWTIDGRVAGAGYHFRISSLNWFYNPHDAATRTGLRFYGIEFQNGSRLYLRRCTQVEIAYCLFTEWDQGSSGSEAPHIFGPGDEGDGADIQDGFGVNSIHHNVMRQLYTRTVHTDGSNGNDYIKEPQSCDIYNNSFIGVLVTPTQFIGADHQDMIQTAGGDEDLRIYNNYFENSSNYMVYLENFGNNAHIYNNVFNQSDPNLANTQAIATGSQSGTVNYNNHKYFNNTFRGLTGSGSITFGGPNTTNNSTDCYIQNNLMFNSAGILVRGTQPNTIVTNNFTGATSAYFVNQATGNFRLTASATGAINQGISTVPSTIFTTDADGNTRTGTWDIGAYEFDAGVPDTTRPTLQSASINTAGTTLTRVFSEPVNTGSGDNAGWSITAGGGAVTGSYASGTGTATILYTLSRTVNVGEAVTTSYTQPGNGVEDLADNDMLTTTIPVLVTNNSTQGEVAAPEFAPVGGSHFGTQNIAITSATSGTTIYYTTDGSAPDSGDSVYSTPVPVSTNRTLRAIATKATMVDSAISSATYEVNSWSGLMGSWKTFSVPAQTVTFPWNFRASVSSATSNTVIGLASALVDAYDDMSVIVRFNETGTIDVHNNANGNYQAVNTVAYTPGVAYSFACSINMTANTYSVSVTPAGGSSTVLATNYVFRASQPDPTELDNFGMFIVSGTATVDQMTIGSDLTAPTPNPRLSKQPSSGGCLLGHHDAPRRRSMTSAIRLNTISRRPVGHAGGTDSGWQSSPTYVDTGLSPNTLYTYYVWSRDAVLNQSSPSSSFSATTPAVITGARANCETLNVTTLQVASPPGSAQTTSQFGFIYPAFTGASGAMTAPQFVTSFSAAMHHPQQYRNWITEGKDIRLLNPAGIYAKHVNIRTIYPDDLSHPNHDYVMNVHPEWLLLNGDGNPVSLFVPEEKCVDFANDDYLDWVLNTWLPTEFVDTTDDDSGLLTFYVHDNGNFLAQTITPNCSHSWCAPYKTDAGMQAAWKHMLDRWRSRWPNKKILVSTGPVSYQTPEVQLPRFTDVLAHSDGYFSESLTSDHVYWSGQPNNQKRNALETTMQLADWLAHERQIFLSQFRPWRWHRTHASRGQLRLCVFQSYASRNQAILFDDRQGREWQLATRGLSRNESPARYVLGSEDADFDQRLPQAVCQCHRLREPLGCFDKHHSAGGHQ